MRLNFSSLDLLFLFPLYCRYFRQTGRQEADYHLTPAVVTLLGWFVLVCHVGNLKLFLAWFLVSKSSADVYVRCYVMFEITVFDLKFGVIWL